ncbi:MAG: hypothetical protein CUN55_16020, partial [Phototrophicales bacterium]
GMRNANEELINFTLDKWEQTGNPELEKLARSLRRGLQLAKWLRFAGAGIIGIMLVLLIVNILVVLLPFIVVGIGLFIAAQIFIFNNND